MQAINHFKENRLNQYNVHKIKSHMHKNSTSNETVEGIA